MDDIELLKRMYADISLAYERNKITMQNDFDAKLELLDLLRKVMDILFSECSKSRISKEDKKLLEPIARRVGRVIE